MSRVNVRLTVHGRRRIVDRVAAGCARSPISLRSWACPGTPHTGGSYGSGQRGQPDCRTARAGLDHTHTHECRTGTSRPKRPTALPVWSVTGRDAHRVSGADVARILQRHGVPRLADCDPLTGVPIRAARTTANGYERERPVELVYLDVTKLGRIPDGGGWRPTDVPSRSRERHQVRLRPCRHR
jgi:hypothetical protein